MNYMVYLCMQMSNYMVYLVFVNPEMLLPGSRRNLFTKAHREVEARAMFMDTEPPLDKGALTARARSTSRFQCGSARRRCGK